MTIFHEKQDQIINVQSGQCNWKDCVGCGWGKLKFPVSVENLKQQILRVKLDPEKILKIFESGSFFDDDQIPREFRQWFAQHCKEQGIRHLVLESRPEFITEENLNDFRGVGIDMHIAIGLESTDNAILKKYNKGFTFEDYKASVDVIRKVGFKVRTFILVNMYHSQQLDLEKSIEETLPLTDSLVIINMMPHASTSLFSLWVNGLWKPFDRKQFYSAVDKWKDNPKAEIDFDNFVFAPKFVERERVMIKGATVDNLKHKHFEVWQDFIQRIYERPERKDIALFLPCSFQKPYERSQTHTAIDKVLQSSDLFPRIHKLVISTPGVVPFEFNSKYPFNSYDWPEWEETSDVRQEYVNVNAERIRKYLENHEYKMIVCYLKPTSDTYKALERACQDLGLKFTNLLSDEVFDLVSDLKNPVARPEALANLRRNLAGVTC
ncbi:MAG: DUF5591 domain-containing protein [DPANN group archaeon]|nr:DUF5591 domain-containing protein [DPANN group archaeon]